MRFHYRRTVKVVLVASLVLTPGVVYVAPALDDRAACVRIKEWASARPEELPATLEELAAFPKEVRRSVFSELNAETKALIWQTHLDELSESGRVLTAAQRAFVVRVRAYVSPTLYLEAAGSRPRSELKKLFEQNQELFDKATFREWFFDLGASKTDHTFASMRMSLTQKLRSLYTANASGTASAELGGCKCSTAWQTYDCGSPSCSEQQDCTQGWGCGPLWTEWCVGLCSA